MSQFARLTCSITLSVMDNDTHDYRDTTVSLYKSETGSYVEVCDPIYYPEGLTLGNSSKDAGWRDLIEILHHTEKFHYEADDNAHPIDVFERLEVFGASGIRALALKCAVVWQFFSVGEWIAQQSDYLLDEFGDDIVRLVNSSQPDAGFYSLVELLDVAEIVGCETDIDTLIDRFGVGGRVFDVQGMLLAANAELDRIHQVTSFNGLQAYKESSEQLKLLCSRFKVIRQKHAHMSEQDICIWIRNYCLSHGYFPTGRHEILKYGRYGSRLTSVEINFNDLTFFEKG